MSSANGFVFRAESFRTLFFYFSRAIRQYSGGLSIEEAQSGHCNSLTIDPFPLIFIAQCQITGNIIERKKSQQVIDFDLFSYVFLSNKFLRRNMYNVIWTIRRRGATTRGRSLYTAVKKISLEGEGRMGCGGRRLMDEAAVVRME